MRGAFVFGLLAAAALVPGAATAQNRDDGGWRGRQPDAQARPAPAPRPDRGARPQFQPRPFTPPPAPRPAAPLSVQQQAAPQQAAPPQPAPAFRDNGDARRFGGGFDRRQQQYRPPELQNGAPQAAPQPAPGQPFGTPQAFGDRHDRRGADPRGAPGADPRGFSGDGGRRDFQDGRREFRDDRRDFRDDRRDFRDDRRAFRRDNRDFGRPHDNRRTWNRDWRHDNRWNWQEYRRYNHDVFRLPRYYAPYGWNYGYQRFTIGFTLSEFLFDRRYWIDDPYYYHLPPAYYPYEWVRYYNDALLVNVETGEVVDVIYGIFY